MEQVANYAFVVLFLVSNYGFYVWKKKQIKDDRKHDSYESKWKEEMDESDKVKVVYDCDE